MPSVPFVPSPARLTAIPRLVATAVAVVALGALMAGLVPRSAQAASGDCDEIRWVLRNKFNPFTDSLDLIRVPVCYRNGRPVAGPRPNAASRVATRGQLRRLRFVPSATVSARVRERLVTAFIGDGEGEQADRGRAQIRSGDLMSQFRRTLRRQHWSTRDAGDIYAMAYIQSWMGVNGKTTVSDRVAEAVRKDLKNTLALDASFRRSGDAAQQDTAEWVASHTVIVTASMQTAMREGRTESVRLLRDYLRDRAKDRDLFDTDLTKVTLARTGVRRR